MIDHLLRFTDEPTAQANSIVGSYFTTTDDSSSGWRGDICIPGVQVYVVSNGVRIAFPGWFIVIALSALDPDLRDLPKQECRLIADREAAAAGNPNFILYLASDIDPVVLSMSRVEPTFAGSDYPFGN